MFLYNEVWMESLTKQILAHIQKTGGASITEIAEALGVKKEPVRRRLHALPKEWFVKERKSKNWQRGWVYSLSEEFSTSCT